MTGNSVDIGGYELPVCRRCARDASSTVGSQEKAVYADDSESDTCSSAVPQHSREARTPTGSDVSSTTPISPQEDIVWALDWSWWTGGCVANNRVADSNYSCASADEESRPSNDKSPCSVSEEYHPWNCL